jgi:DNA-binding NarL/FixJ family response regulator
VTGRIRLLIADDHPVVRAGLRGILDSQPDFEVVGEAATPSITGMCRSGCTPRLS